MGLTKRIGLALASATFAVTTVIGCASDKQFWKPTPPPEGFFDNARNEFVMADVYTDPEQTVIPEPVEEVEEPEDEEPEQPEEAKPEPEETKPEEVKPETKPEQPEAKPVDETNRFRVPGVEAMPTTLEGYKTYTIPFKLTFENAASTVDYHGMRHKLGITNVAGAVALYDAIDGIKNGEKDGKLAYVEVMLYKVKHPEVKDHPLALGEAESAELAYNWFATEDVGKKVLAMLPDKLYSKARQIKYISQVVGDNGAVTEEGVKKLEELLTK